MHAPDGRPLARIGMAVYGDVTYDSRVRKEAATLASAGYQVSLFCLAGESVASDLPEGVTVIAHQPSRSAVLPRSPNPYRTRTNRVRTVLDRAGWLRGYVANLRAWGRWVMSHSSQVDMWHAHDLTALVAIAPCLGHEKPVVYDAHEIYLEAGTARLLPSPARRLLRMYEGRLVARVSAMVTVNRSLADVFTTRYRPARIVVLHNCPDRWQPPSDPSTLIRKATGIPPDAPVILHHGSLGSNRGIEQLLDAITEPGLEQAHLVLLGFGEHRESYATMGDTDQRRGRVHLLDAVSPTVLLDWVSSADVGAMPIQASTMNHNLSTPNKLFECMAAGVPVIASDFPTMRNIVMDKELGPLGAMCDPSDVESIADGLRSVLTMSPADAAALRARCLAAASQRWNWQTESQGLLALYDDLRSRIPAPIAA